MSSRTEPLPTADARPAANLTADTAEAADRARPLPLGHALLLGLMHGPAELLPISSSGHVAVVPWLLGWDDGDSDPESRKAFEVALHAGTAAALLIALRSEVEEALHGMGPRLLWLHGLSLLPPAVVGYALERPIERRLGTPATIAVGLIAGSVALAWGDRSSQRRAVAEAGPADALVLGMAQASALVPGVSRNGATLAAARRRQFTRRDASRLSRHIALPVIAAAAVRKTAGVARRGLPPRSAAPFALGGVASFASTLGSTWLIHQLERDRPLLPYALYRTALAGLILRRLAGDASGARR